MQLLSYANVHLQSLYRRNGDTEHTLISKLGTKKIPKTF